MKIFKHAVDNLKCAGCENRIKKSLMKIEGIKDIDINSQSGTITIQHEELMNTDVFKNTLDTLGYPMLGTSNQLQKAKSYISCAIGSVTK